MVTNVDRITEYSELEATHKDHPVQHLNEWPIQQSNLQSISTVL